ncbi:MAG: hypothetical protein JSS09_04935 [Verrucomicrobia bacterium]|nr:hypothetical protein [Verrucomicrobiota bacterium]
MNLMRLQVGAIDVIDQNTIPLFEERFAGLGSLIGPHFHHRPLNQIPPVPFESSFPHIAKLKAKGVLEPFSHGIARYAPWKAQASGSSITAKLSGEDLWNGVLLSVLEGFSFQMELSASLLPKGISLDLSIESENPSLVGLHYYYTLPLGGGKIKAAVENQYRSQDACKPIPASFLDSKGNLFFDATQEIDVGFIPKLTKEGFEVFYENTQFTLKISFQVDGDEASWQLYRPQEASYICIEPLSTKTPKHPASKKSRLQVRIEILEIKA